MICGQCDEEMYYDEKGVFWVCKNDLSYVRKVGKWSPYCFCCDAMLTSNFVVSDVDLIFHRCFVCGRMFYDEKYLGNKLNKLIKKKDIFKVNDYGQIGATKMVFK